MTITTSAAAGAATTINLHQRVTYFENACKLASKTVTVCWVWMAHTIKCAAPSDSAPMASFAREKRSMATRAKVRVSAPAAIASRTGAEVKRMREPGVSLY